MRVWSLTPFFNELEVLEIRLATLESVVDTHVICEADRCYSGRIKPLYLMTLPSDHVLRRWNDSVRYIPMPTDRVPGWPLEDYSNPPAKAFEESASARWDREHAQRDYLATACPDMDDDDLVFLSDVDEVPNPDIFDQAHAMLESGNLGFGCCLPVWMPQHVYYLNWGWGSEAINTIARFCSGQTMKEYGPQRVRQISTPAWTNSQGGWHLAYMGGPQRVSYKILNAAHEELIAEEYYDISRIQERMASRRDMFDRTHRQPRPLPLEQLPQYVQENEERFFQMGLLWRDSDG